MYDMQQVIENCSLFRYERENVCCFYWIWKDLWYGGKELVVLFLCSKFVWCNEIHYEGLYRKKSKSVMSPWLCNLLIDKLMSEDCLNISGIKNRWKIWMREQYYMQTMIVCQMIQLYSRGHYILYLNGTQSLRTTYRLKNRADNWKER